MIKISDEPVQNLSHLFPNFWTPWPDSDDPDVRCWLWYDGPVLFTCRTAKGDIALAVSVDDEEGPDYYIERWSVAVMSDELWQQVKAGQLTFREIYGKSHNFIIDEKRISIRTDSVIVGSTELTGWEINWNDLPEKYKHEENVYPMCRQ